MRLLLGVGVAMAVLCGAQAKGDEMASRAAGRGGKLFATTDVDALMARPYLDHVPMACTGECLWAAHPAGWAFGNGTHYYLLTPWGVGYDLELAVNGERIEPAEGTMRPSHVRMSGAGGGVRVDGAKWITADDVLAVRLTLENTTDGVVTVGATLTLPTDTVEVAGQHRLWQVKQHGLDIALMAAAPGFEPDVDRHDASLRGVYPVEGERPQRQDGSTGSDAKGAASGGEGLGSNFGGEKGHFAEWDIDVSEALADGVLSFRYSRGKMGEGAFRVEVNGKAVSERHGFKETGGWGDAPEQFNVASFDLGAVPAGEARVRVEALETGSNVNFDRLAIHARDARMPLKDLPKLVLLRDIQLPAGAKETLSVHVAAGTRDEKRAAALERVAGLEDPLRDQIDAYNGWLIDNVPDFRSDEALTRQYWHRATSILKKSLFKVGEGRLPGWGIVEGRWNNSWYPNIISYGAGHQVRETRWLRDPGYVRDILSTWCANEKTNGVFPNYIRPDEIGDGQYTDWITSTAWDAYCVAPDADVARAWADALKRNVDGWLATYDPDNDGLLLVDSHWWTGMEWQPSFFAFNGFDKDKQDQQLERVDLTAYVYGNARNLSRLLETIGDAEGARHYAGVAERIAKATAETLWDEGTQFFYSVEPKTHEKAMVKEVIGVYPFYFSMFEPGSKYTAAWASILDPEQFWTAWPVASATKQCPAYSQDVTFNGKDVGGCMWNGPTWPHANSIVLSAMAATLRESGEGALKVGDFHALLRSFTMQQFLKQDLRFPWTGEYLNGDTAEWRTPERDYNHSTYIDVIIADYVGLRPRADDVLELRPLLAADTPGFVLDGVRYHGHDVTVAWEPAGEAAGAPDGLTGFRVYVDGELAHRDEGVPGAVELPLGG